MGDGDLRARDGLAVGRHDTTGNAGGGGLREDRGGGEYGEQAKRKPGQPDTVRMGHGGASSNVEFWQTNASLQRKASPASISKVHPLEPGWRSAPLRVNGTLTRYDPYVTVS
ncbi:hypothetical protein GCM10027359_24510 [Marilutibacter aestuarii]